MRPASVKTITAIVASIGFAIAVSVWLSHRHLHPPPIHTAAAPMQAEPLTILWAWETPEDLHTLNPTTTGVAFLAQEISLATSPQIHPRRQPLIVPPGTWLMAVTRLEPTATFADTPTLRAATTQAIVATAHLPNIRAVQIDFDATPSQYAFYTAILTAIRAQLPASTPLSITALVSWCNPASWLAHLPPNARPAEAVPMFFRMGGPTATRAHALRTAAAITIPACAGSTGVATDEAWPEIHTAQRVYIFRSGPWTNDDLHRLNTIGFQSLQQVPEATP